MGNRTFKRKLTKYLNTNDKRNAALVKDLGHEDTVQWATDYLATADKECNTYGIVLMASLELVQAFTHEFLDEIEIKFILMILKEQKDLVCAALP